MDLRQFVEYVNAVESHPEAALSNSERVFVLCCFDLFADEPLRLACVLQRFIHVSRTWATVVLITPGNAVG